MPAIKNWDTAFKPLITKYKNKKHPLEYKNIYQLLVMVLLSAQDSDKHINQLAPVFFKKFVNMKILAKADEETMLPFINSVRNFGNKIKWLMELSKKIKDDKNIPLTMETLTALPGIGRKSANVILREAGVKAEGIIVDLHVVRVAPRIGIASGTNPKKIEKQMMENLSRKYWGQAGMAVSFLGRETCRPSNPKCDECVMKTCCAYFKSLNLKTTQLPMPVKFSAVIKKFDKQGEKTGWSYIEIPASVAQKIKPATKTSYRVKGKIDAHKLEQVALLPMGDGSFIIPLNANMRKAIGKRQGYEVTVHLQHDSSDFRFNSDFIECLSDEPKAAEYFKTLPGSHQKYFSKWIDSAKTDETKAKRIAMAVKALAQKMGYADMLKASSKNK
jgi:endonuclease-3